MELKIEKLFGEELAGKLALPPGRGRREARFTLPVRSPTIRSFLRLSRAYYVGGNPRYHFPRLGEISLCESPAFFIASTFTFLFHSEGTFIIFL